VKMGDMRKDKFTTEVLRSGPAFVVRMYSSGRLVAESYHQTLREAQMVLEPEQSEWAKMNGRLWNEEFKRDLHSYFKTAREYDEYVLRVSAKPSVIRKRLAAETI
jgi:hypothetical protein